jgi:hypothetical protein
VPPSSGRHANHNGGQLAFGPDGDLYIALGDGGSGGDPNGSGQSLGTLLGKILRIDARPGNGRPYRIPAGNPFTGRAGSRPEIWDYGAAQPLAVLIRPGHRTCGSVTSARAAGRKSTTSRPAPAVATMAGTCARAPTAMPATARPARSTRSSSAAMVAVPAP